MSSITFDTFQGLTVIGIRKTYKKNRVIKNINLHIQRGEAVGLLGPNGAGKTTIFSIMAGLIAPNMGKVYLDSVDITKMPMYRRARLGVGYLPQEASIFRGMSVEDNIRSVLEIFERDRDRREIILDELLGSFMLSHLKKSAALSLSGGERRRVEIARALASQPQFILLDEPLTGIDPIAIREIRELISHLKERDIGCTYYRS